MGGGAGKVPLVQKLNYLKKFSRKSSGIQNFFKKFQVFNFFKSIVPARMFHAILLPPNDFLKMAGCLRTHRFLSLFLVLDMHQIPPRRLGHATPSKSLPGACGGF